MVHGTHVPASFRGTICRKLGDPAALAGNRSFPISNKSVLFQYQTGTKESKNHYLYDRFDDHNCRGGSVSAITAIWDQRRRYRVASRTECDRADSDNVGYAKMGMKMSIEHMYICTLLNAVNILQEILLSTKILDIEQRCKQN